MTRPKTISKYALLGAVSSAALLAMGTAQAQLGTPTIISGTADAPVITPDAGTPGRTLSVDITQTSDRLIVHWDNMDIASDQSVNFNQATSDIAVNRITGGSVDGTTIDGLLSADGHVWVIDPNGITFGANANVDVNGLLATTADFADVTDPDTIGFLAENNAFVFGSDVTLVFDVEGTPGATIDTTALGSITAGEGGVKIIAEGINHQGLIETTDPIGVVELVSTAGNGTEVFSLTVDASNGAGLVQVPVSSDSSTVELAGRIAALGGTIRITAAGASAAIQNVASAGAVIEADTITMQSDGTISLTNAANDFVGSVDASATSVVLTDTNSIELGDIDTAGTLTVTAGGSITDGAQGSAGDDLDVGGVTTLTAGSTIVLNDQTHDFESSVNASGTSVTLADAGDITLGDIDTVGILTVVSAGGSISDGVEAGANSDINAGGANLTATDDITVNDTTNVIGGSFAASGDDVDLDFQGAAPTLSSISATGDLALEVDGTLTGGPFDVDGTSTFTSNSGSILLLDNVNNAFGGAVTANATDAITILTDGSLTANATAQDIGGIDSGNIVTLTAGGTLTASATGNDITLTGSNVLLGSIDALEDAANAGGDLTVVATLAAGTINGSPAGDILVEGDTSLTGPGGVSLVDASNDFVQDVSVSSTGGAISLTDSNDLTITSLVSGVGLANDLTLTAGGTLLTPAIVANDVSLVASTITTTNITAGNGGSLIFTTDGNISGAGLTLNIGGDSTFTSNNGSVVLTDNTDVFGGSIAAIAPSTTGSVTIDLLGDRTISALAGSAGSTNASNTVNVTTGGALTLAQALGQDVTLQGSSLILRDLDVEGALLAEATSSSISDDAQVGSGSDVDVAGTSTLIAVTDITVNDTTNNFGGQVNATTTTGSISVADRNALSLVARAGTSGSIISSNTVVANAAGALTLTEALGYSVDATGASVSLGQVDAEQDGALTGGDLTVSATTGSIDDDLAGTLAIAGNASFTALTNSTSIVIDDAGHLFGGTLTANGHDVTFDFGTTTPTITSIVASGDLSLRSDDTLTSGFLDVTGTTNLVSDAGSISFTDSTNNVFGGLVTAIADGSIALSSDQAMSVDAAAQAAGGLNAGNTVTLVSGGNLSVSALGNTIDLTGDVVTIDELDALQTVGLAGGDLTVSATSIVDTSGDGLLVEGLTDLFATASIVLDNIANDFADLVTAVTDVGASFITLVDTNDLDIQAFTGSLLFADPSNAVDVTAGGVLNAETVQAGSVSLEGASVVLGAIDTVVEPGGPAGDLTVIANSGSITDAFGLGGVIEGPAEFTAATDVTIDDLTLLGAVTATTTSGGISIVNAGNLVDVTALAGVPGSISAANTVSLNASGDITTVQVRGNAIVLDGNNVSLGDIDALEDTLGSGGGLTVIANTGTITDSQAILVEGLSSFDAVGDITVDEAGTDFIGAVTATSTSGGITLLAANDLTAMAFAGTSGSITASNTVRLEAGGALTVTDLLGFSADLQGGDVSLGAVATEQDAGLTAGSGDLTVVATTGSIDDDTVGDLNVAGDAAFNALSTNTSIVIDDTGNVFGGSVRADGDDVTFAFAASQLLGAVRATGDLIISAVGSLSGEPLDVDGTTELTSSGSSISFVDNANSFDGVVTLDAATSIDLITSGALSVISSGGVTTLDAASIAITSLQASSLDATATGDITGGSATVTGLTTLESTSGTINLAANDFQGQVTATAASAAGSVTLADTGDLDVIAVAGSAGALTSANVINVASNGALTVTGDANALIASGSSVVLGDISTQTDTLGSGGTLMVTANTGSVTDSGILLVEGMTDVIAVTDVLLDNAANDFVGLVSALSSSGDVTVVDANTLTIDAAGASIALSGSSVQLNDIDASGNLMVIATGGSIDDGVTTSAGGDINVAGDTVLEATSGVTMDDLTNDFQGAVSASGTSIVLADSNDLQLGDIDTAGDLTVTVVTGSITDDVETAVGDDIDVGGDAVFAVSNPAAGSLITINDLTNAFSNLVSASGFDILFGFGGAQSLGTITAAGDLNVAAAGDLTGGPLIVSGTTDLTSAPGSLTFTDIDNAFGGQVTANASQDITLSSGGSLTVQANAGGDLSLESGTVTIVSASATTLDVVASGAITGGSVGATGVATLLSLNDAISLSNNAFEGRVTAQAAGAIDLSQTTDLSVDASGADITLTSEGRLSTTTTGTTVNLTGGDVTIETVSASQNLTVVSSNTITGGTVDVMGSTVLDAMGDIDLASTANRFGTNISAEGANIQLGTSGDFTLGTTVATGDLSVVTDGSVADGASPIIVAGRTSVTAGGSVVLDNASNDFGGAFSASGTTVHVADANSLVLGDIVTAGDLRIVFDADRAVAPDPDVRLTDDDGSAVMVAGSTDISTGLAANTSLLSDAGGPSISLDNASHRFDGGLALRRIGGSVFLSEMADPSETALVLRNLEVGGDLTIQTGRSITLVGRLTAEDNGVFGLDPVLTSGQPTDAVVANQGVDGLSDASFHLFIPDGATWTFDTTAGGASEIGTDVRFDRPIDSLGDLALSVDDIALRQDNASETGSLSISAGTNGEVRFRDFVGANRPLGLVRVLSAGSAFLGSTLPTSPENEDDDAFLMARQRNPLSNADLNLRDFFYAASLTFEDVQANAQVLVPDVHANNGFEFFGINVTGGNGRFEGGPLDGRAISGFVFGGRPQFLEVFGGIAPLGGDIIRGASAGLVADGINISARTVFNGCQIGDTSTCINLDIPVVVTAPQNTLTIDTVAMDDANDSNFLAFGNEQLWANPPTFFILAPLATATEE